METQRILDFFKRPEKLLLGVCGKLSQKLGLPPMAIRIALIIITLIFIPLGILLYIGLYLVIDKKKGRLVSFGLMGGLLGIPLSYYFQSDMIKNWPGNSGMVSYLGNFTKVVDQYDQLWGNGWDIVYNVFVSVIVFALVGGAIGYFMDKKE